MRDRFTRKSKTGRGEIPKNMRRAVFERDSLTCQFCGEELQQSEATIDHLIPLALGGLDEVTNWVSCCRSCNHKKADMSLNDFAKALGLDIRELPIHGDPVVDNVKLPVELRMIRWRIFERMRSGRTRFAG